MKEIVIPIRMICNNCGIITNGSVEITVADCFNNGIRIEGEAVCQECAFGQEFREVNFIFKTIISENKDND